LLPIVERAVYPNQVASFEFTVDSTVSWRYFGLRGDKLIVSFDITDRDGNLQRVNAFAKRYYQPVALTSRQTAPSDTRLKLGSRGGSRYDSRL